MAYAFIRNGVVENVADTAPPPGWSLPGMSVVQSNAAKVGDLYNGSTFTTPGASVPASMSRRQFIIGMLQEGFLTANEADLLSEGVIPQVFATVIDGLPVEHRIPAKITIRMATEFYRNNPLMIAGLTVVGATEAQLDDFFRKYAAV